MAMQDPCHSKSMAILKYGVTLVIASCFAAAYAADDEPTVTCSSKDREALLSFKRGIKEDTTEILSSWIGTECCGGWEGVECNPRTGRVTALTLQSRASTNASIFMRGIISPALGDLKFLQVLIISDMRYIEGLIPVSISTLLLLTQLYIENNQVRGSIPPELGRLSRLEALSLAGNGLTGGVPAEVGEMKRLVQLNLGRNRLTGRLPPAMAGLARLQSLDVAENLLSGPLPEFIGSFVALTYLDLSGNLFSGGIPPSLGNLSNILDVNLARNKLSGTIPLALGRMRSLSSLSLSNNMLEGSIPESLGNMTMLWYLNLSRNHLSDPLPSSLGNSSSLICLDLSYNALHLGRIPEWITTREMTNLHLASCGVRQCLSTWQPRAMSSLLTSIDLSHNHLTGDITHLLRNMTSLQKVYLANNNLSTNLSDVSLPDSVTTLDLHSNQIYGTVDNIFSNNISESCLSAGGCLEFINLANNKITGRMPEILGERSIRWLDLSGNRLRGGIPTSISMLKGVVRLDFSGNRMVGKIPGTIGALKELRWLDLAGNALKGRIPAQILGLKHLKHLNLRNNRLCGEIPPGKPLMEFPASAYAHNDCLCGTPLPRCNK